MIRKFIIKIQVWASLAQNPEVSRVTVDARVTRRRATDILRVRTPIVWIRALAHFVVFSLHFHNFNGN